ncbi:unnamed protein product [Caretta caretta]
MPPLLPCLPACTAPLPCYRISVNSSAWRMRCELNFDTNGTTSRRIHVILIPREKQSSETRRLMGDGKSLSAAIRNYGQCPYEEDMQMDSNDLPRI